MCPNQLLHLKGAAGCPLTLSGRKRSEMYWEEYLAAAISASSV